MVLQLFTRDSVHQGAYHCAENIEEAPKRPRGILTGDDQSTRKFMCITLLSGICVALLALAVYTASTLRRQRGIDLNCGTSIEEAKAKDCRFEAMQRAWIPAACYFTEPSAEYRPFEDREWFLDEQLQRPADLKALNAGEVPVAFTANFHQEHCTYNWRKLAIAVDRKILLVDSRVGSLHHSTHCALGLAQQTNNMSACTVAHGRNSLTKSNLNFLECTKLL